MERHNQRSREGGGTGMSNIRYIPSSVADQLSNALWRLSDPNCDEKATQYLFGWITDNNGAGWLEASTDAVIKVDPAAPLGEITTLLQPWIDNQILPADTLTILAQTVADHAASGEPLNVYNTFPQYFKDASKDRVTMIAEGLIDDPSLNLASPPSPIRVIPNAPRSKPI